MNKTLSRCEVTTKMSQEISSNNIDNVPENTISSIKTYSKKNKRNLGI